jgi:hypothetical protein
MAKQDGEVNQTKSVKPQPPMISSGLDTRDKNGDAGMVEEIRELLFGARLREQEKQFQVLQARVADEMQNLQASISQRVDDIEGFLKQELRNLNERLKAEHDGWERACNKGGTDVSSIRELVLEKSRTLSEEMRASQSRQAQEMARDIKFLSETKLARSQMVELLNAWSLNIGYGSEEKNASH